MRPRLTSLPKPHELRLNLALLAEDATSFWSAIFKPILTASIWLFWQKMRLPLRTRNPRAQLAASIWLFWQKMRPKTKGLPRIGLARLNLALLAEDATADSKRYSIAESCTSLCDHLIPALQKDTGKTSESLHISLIFNKHERKYRHMEGTTTLAAFTRDRICCQKSKKVFPMAEER